MLHIVNLICKIDCGSHAVANLICTINKSGCIIEDRHSDDVNGLFEKKSVKVIYLIPEK
jgi:hypothetical protein